MSAEKIKFENKPQLENLDKAIALTIKSFLINDTEKLLTELRESVYEIICNVQPFSSYVGNSEEKISYLIGLTKSQALTIQRLRQKYKLLKNRFEDARFTLLDALKLVKNKFNAWINRIVPGKIVKKLKITYAGREI